MRESELVQARGPIESPAKPIVLVVDDQPSNVEVIGGYLSDRYDVQYALSGPEALDLVAAALPDLILLDVMMPGIDGYAVCDALKSDPRTEEIPIIFVTAKDDTDSETHALNAGAVDFIHKPINPPVLKARVATQIKLKQHIDELRELAITDPLTGLANRRLFFDRLELEWRRSLRHAHPLSLLMIDVDHFKAYNDHYGHPAGDVCLQKVAKAIGETVTRAGELVARYGGEEFVVLLANTSPTQAEHVAERIRIRVQGLDLVHGHSHAGKRVTVSIGVASARFGTPAAEGASAEACRYAPDHLIDLADRSLYVAKQSGRNRVHLQALNVENLWR